MSDQLMVGGESAGGGLCAAVCIRARDDWRGERRLSDAALSRCWTTGTPQPRAITTGACGTRGSNHSRDGAAICAAPTGRRCRHTLRPPALRTWRGCPRRTPSSATGEPFYAETLEYIRRLKDCGIPASVDVYETDMHAFDMMRPKDALSIEAARRFNESFAYAQAHYFAPQK